MRVKLSVNNWFFTLDSPNEQVQTNFIENPFEEIALNEGESPTTIPILIPVKHENLKKLSQENRLSSLDSIFDQNVSSSHEQGLFVELQNPMAIRKVSSDSYFDKI